jgi:acyl carrier protein
MSWKRRHHDRPPASRGRSHRNPHDEDSTMTTLDRLTHLIHDKFGVALDVIDPDAPFASYDLDSLTVAELMFEIDDALHVTVPDEAATTVTTLRQLAVLIDGLPVVARSA